MSGINEDDYLEGNYKMRKSKVINQPMKFQNHWLTEVSKLLFTDDLDHSLIHSFMKYADEDLFKAINKMNKKIQLQRKEIAQLKEL